MSDFKIRDISFYNFLFVIFGLILISGILYFSLNKIKNLNEKLFIITSTQNSFLEMKIHSESLLTTIDLEKKKSDWTKAIEKFDNDLTKLQTMKKDDIKELWYVTKKEINEIKESLEDDLLSPEILNQKPILMIKGELFSNSTKAEQYIVISSIIRKIELLIQYENLIFKEFKKTYIHEKSNIDAQLYNTLYAATILILFILITLIGMISIFNKRISIIEKKLINTQNKLNENYIEIKDSKLLLQNIIDSIPAAIFWKDINNRYLGVNRYILNNAGLTKHEDIIGKTDFDMPWAETEAQNFIDDDQEVILSGEPKLHFEETLTQDDGTTITVITSKVPLRNSRNEIVGILGIYMDVTEKKHMEEMLDKKNQILTQQSKMAALGEMLENITHQWRQPLSLILSTTTGLKLKIEFDQLEQNFLLESVDNIISSVEHMNSTINDFRDYFKADKQARYFNFDKIVDKSLLLVQSKLKNNLIEIKKDIKAKDIYGFENEFIQVLINIITNSVYVFEHGDFKEKLIFIESKEIEVCGEEVDKDVASCKCIEIKIYDNAGGIPENIIDKVFHSHFTTKGDEGTGIGLYMSAEIVNEHMKGFISVNNKKYKHEGNEYKGAEFTILIPSQKYDS